MQSDKPQLEVTQAIEQPVKTVGIFAVPKVRSLIIDGLQYHISLKSSIQRVDHRFELERYAHVECEGHWQAVVPAPPMVRDVEHLWYREMMELIDRAQVYVRMRNAG